MHFLKKVEPGKDGSQRVSKVRYRSGKKEKRRRRRETKYQKWTILMTKCVEAGFSI